MGIDEPRTLRRFASSSPEATQALAAALGARLPAGSVLALEGELGAGKTCFVRGLALGLGIEEAVSSPTFTLMHRYEGPRHLLHYDAWMEGRERAFLADGGAEWLGEDAVAAIEWAERVRDFLPRPHLGVELCHRGPDERGIVLRLAAGGSPARERALEELVRGLEPPAGIVEEGA